LMTEPRVTESAAPAATFTAPIWLSVTRHVVPLATLMTPVCDPVKTVLQTPVVGVSRPAAPAANWDGRLIVNTAARARVVVAVATMPLEMRNGWCFMCSPVL